ncbi:acetyl-CoA acetyltransferase [Candidatus Skiveiella danica]|jgi:acetyl-CoA C-acetyltransferase|uniref:acetyl-CoA acetyltransferase n=1 Tax=Candidatus Skiveiella danica TaxID=3386177 RepID=UPI0039B8E1BF
MEEPMMLDKTRVPVIVGVGQVTDTTSPPESARSPLQMMLDAARLAAADSGAGEALWGALDSITVIRLFADTVPRFASPFGKLVNPPWSVARRLGAQHATDLVYPPQGGDSPQVLLARACERIARGESQAALIVGGEALRTELAAKRAGLALQWGEDAPTLPDGLGGVKDMYTAEEEAHGMRSAIAMYALIGQALRGAAGQTVDAYREASARLFAGFAAVAKANPLATRRAGYSAEAISTLTQDNPYVGFPFTKLMTASAFIDQSAAFIVVSEARADELGVPQDRRVYLHGSAAAHDEWFVSERPRLDESPAMRLCAQHALAQAGRSLADVSHLDIYSCFPSAVQIACKELGLSPEDPRGLTVTGGLPYFGGPGNNYVTHAIAEMVQRVRGQPGSYGLVMANGGLVTKEAVGIYSTMRPEKSFVRESASLIQDQIDRMPKQELDHEPRGEAVIETYAVLHGKSGPERCVLFGKLVSTGARFLANTPGDAQTLATMQSSEGLGLRGQVSREGDINVFVPAS